MKNQQVLRRFTDCGLILYRLFYQWSQKQNKFSVEVQTCFIRFQDFRYCRSTPGFHLNEAQISAELPEGCGCGHVLTGSGHKFDPGGFSPSSDRLFRPTERMPSDWIRTLVRLHGEMLPIPTSSIGDQLQFVTLFFFSFAHLNLMVLGGGTSSLDFIRTS